MKIVLVRHGFSYGNLNQLYSGFTDVLLTEDGIEELKQFKETHHYPKTERYISSSLTRCKDTFHHLFGDEETLHETSDELRELYFGDYENKRSADVSPNYFETFHFNERCANGETLSEFSYRLINKLGLILSDLKKDGLKSATIVCHSGVIKALLIFLESRPFSDFRKISTPNGLGYIVDLDFDEKTNFIKLRDVNPITTKE